MNTSATKKKSLDCCTWSFDLHVISINLSAILKVSSILFFLLA